MKIFIKSIICSLMAMAFVLTGTQAFASPSRYTTTSSGVVQWGRCLGPVNGPTTILVSGLGADHYMWNSVFYRIAKTHRVCIVDRPGLGDSPYSNGSSITNAKKQAAELRSALKQLGETGPEIIVGHSYGSLITRAYAKRYPGLVVGMMLLDGVYPQPRDYWDEGGRLMDNNASAAFLNGGPLLGLKPLIVLTSGEFGSDWIWQQDQATKISKNVMHIQAYNSGHVIQQDNPTAVVRAVRKLYWAVKYNLGLVYDPAAWNSIQVRKGRVLR